MTRFVTVLLLLTTTASPLFAEDKEEVRVRTVKLELSPAPEPVPALRVQFLPGPLDETAGNAAPLYYQAALLISQVDAETLEKAIHWLEAVPSGELPRDEVRKALAAFDNPLRQAELAARRSRCDWNLPIETEGFRLVIPELQQLRTVARVLALKAKLQIVEGDFDAAIRTLQTGYAMARHLSQGPTLVHGLVGVAVATILNYRLEEALSHAPDLPNLYWALTLLPRPMIDLRGAMRTEQVSLYYTCPTLREINSGPLSPQQEASLYRQLTELLESTEDSATLFPKNLLPLENLVEKSYPHSKERLLATGFDPHHVEAMPPLQVVAIDSLTESTRLADDVFRWFYVPFPIANPKLYEATEKVADPNAPVEGIPFAKLYLPSVGNVYRATTRLDQQIAMLRCVEAIRIYAAAHDRRLPGSLADITEVPIPLDPVSGKPFHYELKDNRAVLEGAPTRIQDRYEITIRPAEAEPPSDRN